MAVKGQNSGLDRTQHTAPGPSQGRGSGPGGSIAAAKAGPVAFGGPISQNPNNPRTQNIARSASNFSGLGATPFIANPSFGQIAGALSSLIPGMGTMNSLGGAAMGLANGGGFNSTYTGGLIGSALDHLFGGTPGAATGMSNPDANASFRASPGGFGHMVNPLRPMLPPPNLQLSALQPRPPLGQSMMVH